MTEASFGTGAFGSGPFGGTTGEWQLTAAGDLRTIEAHAGLSISASSLTLSWVDDSDVWDEFERSGDTETTTGFGGAFRAERRDAGSPIYVAPPAAHQPGIRPGEWLPTGFESRQINPTTDEFRLELARPTPRRGAGATHFPDDGSAFGTGAFGSGAFGGEGVPWRLSVGAGGYLGLSESRVVTTAVEADPSGSETTLPLLLTSAELGTIAAVCDRPSAVVERPVPDGRDRRVDTTPDSRQTIGFETPPDAPIDDGEYLVTGWSASPIGALRVSGRWRVDVTIAEASD